MIPILSPQESAALDRESAARGVSVSSLMEAAGRAVARAVLQLAGGGYGRRAVVVCGGGNNGGDGLVAARLLDRWGMGVSTVLVADPAGYRGAAGQAFRRLVAAGVRWRRFAPAALDRELDRAEVAVDAVFGTGFHGEPEGDPRMAIEALNASNVPVVAADVPSGVDGATGAVPGVAVRAALTVTFAALKPGVVFHPGAAHAGTVLVADIGFPPDLVRSDLHLAERSDVAALLPARPAEAHKRSQGVVVAVAGSRTMTGAAALVAGAACRAGAGLVSLAVAEGILPVVEQSLTEPTFVPLPQTEDGTVAEEAWDVLQDRLAGADAVAAGPGMSTNPSTSAFVRRLVAASPAPVVLDADGLNAFAGRAEELGTARSPVVLTPHAGEFARLSGQATDEVLRDRVGSTRRLAALTGCVVLFKGSRTVVAGPDGRAVVTTTGGPFLATGGTGDVLTGTVAALLARGLDPFDAAFAGAYVHGLAGRIARDEVGESIVAGDVLRRLPAALRAVGSGGADGRPGGPGPAPDLPEPARLGRP